ncbi:MAG: hypothetical protein AAGI91_17165 [Bacteroidota bacterium]
MNYNALHPYPRYGAAVALVRAGKTPAEVETPEALAPLVAEAIEAALTQYTVYTLDDPEAEGTQTLTFDWVKDPEPGKSTKQDADHGYYLAPHVVTSDASAAGLLKAAKGFIADLRDGNLSKSTELKRAFAPFVAKVNSGNTSLSYPKATRLNAALTALTTVTPNKAAAWSLGTAGLVPDLPLIDPGEPSRSPLLDYVELFGLLSRQYYDTEAAMRTPRKEGGGYKRPRLHEGNFPEAPSNGALGALGVVASVGWWARHGDTHAVERDAGEWARRVLNLLAERPLLIATQGDSVSKDSRQEQFGHHLVGLALDGDLRAALIAINRVRPVGFVNWKDKASKDKVEFFRMMAGRFVRLFTRPALRDFLATRAAYPAELGFVFDAYFTTHAMPPLSPDLVASARAYGAALNYAAYRAASADAQSDEKRRGSDARKAAEYKQRALVEFESAVQSAKSGPELLAKVGSRAGRLAGFDMPAKAGAFMEAVASWGDDQQKLAQARDLVTAFMRLSTYDSSTSAPAGDEARQPDGDAPETAPEASSQNDLFPDDRT